MIKRLSGGLGTLAVGMAVAGPALAQSTATSQAPTVAAPDAATASGVGDVSPAPPPVSDAATEQDSAPVSPQSTPPPAPEPRPGVTSAVRPSQSTPDTPLPASEPEYVGADSPPEESEGHARLAIQLERRRLRGRATGGIRFGYEAGLGEISVQRTSSSGATFEQTSIVTDPGKRFVVAFDVAFRPLLELAVGVYAKLAFMPETTMRTVSTDSTSLPGTYRQSVVESPVGPGDGAAVGGSLGGLVRAYATPATKSIFWVGVALGHQWLMFGDGGFRGFELAPQAGVDFVLSRSFALGPYADLTFANYSTSLCTGCSGWGRCASFGARASWR